MTLDDPLDGVASIENGSGNCLRCLLMKRLQESLHVLEWSCAWLKVFRDVWLYTTAELRSSFACRQVTDIGQSLCLKLA